MPNDDGDDQRDFSRGSQYGRFFQTTMPRVLAFVQAVTSLRQYEESIKTREENIRKIEELLKGGNLSPSVRSNGEIRLKRLKNELVEHQITFVNLISRDPELQAEFSRQPSTLSR